MRYHTEFFVNGHHCKVEYERREHYSAWLDGEKIDTGHNRAHLAELLIDDAKYRTEREYDFWKVVRATHRFADSVRNDSGWVLEETARNAIFPHDDFGGDVISAFYELEDFGMAEQSEVFIGLNPERMWRITDKDIEEVNMEEVEDPMEEYNSE